eukprot:5852824-Prymnesium_polylepis.1
MPIFGGVPVRLAGQDARACRKWWLPKQPRALHDFLEERKVIGPNQDDPFAAFLYTDDFDMIFPGPELCAFGADVQMHEMNIWMSAKVGAGTAGCGMDTWIHLDTCI